MDRMTSSLHNPSAIPHSFPTLSRHHQFTSECRISNSGPNEVGGIRFERNLEMDYNVCPSGCSMEKYKRNG